MIKDFLTVIRDNWLISVGIVLAGIFKLTQEFELFSNDPIFSDAVNIVCFGVAAVISLRMIWTTVAEQSSFARRKLPSRNPWIYALVQKPSALASYTLLVAACIFVLFPSAKALALHVLPPWKTEQLCFRISADCRQCVKLVDARGREISAGCLKYYDDAGLISITPDRWSHYRPDAVRLSCGTETHTITLAATKEKPRCPVLDL
jgi:hypothetical protein